MLELLVSLFKSFRMGRAAAADIADDQCVACDSRDLTELGPSAYRCNLCGYEGGSGMAALQQGKREAVWETWTVTQRFDSARGDLQEAASLAAAATGTLRSASSAATLDMVGLSGGGGNDGPSETQSALVSGLGTLAEAQALMRDAAAKIGMNAESAEVDAGGYGWAFDLHADGMLADLNMIRRVNDALRAAARTEKQIAEALASLG